MWMSFMSNQMMLLDKSDIAALPQIHFFLFGFSFTNICDSQDSGGEWLSGLRRCN